VCSEHTEKMIEIGGKFGVVGQELPPWGKKRSVTAKKKLFVFAVFVRNVVLVMKSMQTKEAVHYADFFHIIIPYHLVGADGNRGQDLVQLHDIGLPCAETGFGIFEKVDFVRFILEWMAFYALF